MLIVLSPTL